MPRCRHLGIEELRSSFVLPLLITVGSSSLQGRATSIPSLRLTAENAHKIQYFGKGNRQTSFAQFLLVHVFFATEAVF